MREQRNERDVVTGRDHYHTHPSGVECWQMVRWHTFNVGNTIKYVFRRGKRGDSIQVDLGKAINYLNDEIAMDWVQVLVVPDDYHGVCSRFIEHEPDEWVKLALSPLLFSLVFASSEPARRHSLEASVRVLNALLADLNNDGHGHVIPRADGAKVRCGGPALCAVCQRERARVLSS